MKRAWLVAVLVAGAGLTLAGSSPASTGRHRLKCAPGYVRRIVRAPVRKHGRIVRRNGKIVYLRVQRCMKVHKTKGPTSVAPQPIPGAPSKPVVTAGTPSSASPISTTTAPPPPPPSTGSCPGPPPGGSQTLGTHTYALEGVDTFTKDAPTGTFAQSSVGHADANSLQPIYTGDHGMGWSAYPDGWGASYTGSGVEGYQPSTVLSVHDGVLDFYLHDDTNGQPVGADISPWPGGSEYQTYGAYSLCEKVVPSTDLADFYEASLLWPQTASDGACAESDFPETYSPLNGGSLDSGRVYTFSHYGPWSAQSGCTANPHSQDSFNTPIDLSQWHMFTQEWGPGFRSFYLDGTRVYTSTNQVWSLPERWQLQMEPSPSAKVQKDGGTGHVYVSWVWIGTPDN
jgi:hypothetical protein